MGSGKVVFCYQSIPTTLTIYIAHTHDRQNNSGEEQYFRNFVTLKNSSIFVIYVTKEQFMDMKGCIHDRQRVCIHDPRVNIFFLLYALLLMW